MHSPSSCFCINLFGFGHKIIVYYREKSTFKKKHILIIVFIQFYSLYWLAAIVQNGILWFLYCVIL